MSTEAVPKGYKRTEVGVIPEEWDAAPLECFTSFISYGFTNPMPTSDSGIYMITAKDVNNGKVQFETARCTTEDAYNKKLSAKSQPRKNDLLLTKDGTLGRLALVRDETICINQSVAIIRPNSKADPAFLKLLLEAPAYQSKMIEDAGGSTIKHIYITIVNRMMIGVPPSIAEQQAIAAALSDADALIESLEQILAKKRQIKQGAMQELLTGKRRLPGFTGKWEKQSLSCVVANLEAGVSVNSVEHPNPFSTGNQCILKTSAISGGKFYPSECKLIVSGDVARAKVNPQKDTILISRMNTPNLVGEVGYIEFDHPSLFLPDRLWMMTFDSDKGIVPRWLAFVLSSARMQEQIKSLCTGTSGSMKNISKSAILSLQVLSPTLPEQAAIASVLSDMDAELEVLEGKLEKARQVKQGMMQQLLTGKVRLV
ncbi:MAG: restriction endonuclease subunit S [Fibrobacteres bacterium]|nr:restriction endonuclease subunit S [Fibrobacterota bacterium]